MDIRRQPCSGFELHSAASAAPLSCECPVAERAAWQGGQLLRRTLTPPVWHERFPVNWEVAASISEVVSGVAVVASLLLLGRDLRQNTRAMKSANYIKVNDTMIENTCVMMGSQPGGPIFLKAMNGLSNLEFQDYYQFHLVMLGLLRRYETLFVQESLNLIDGWSTEGFKTSLKQLLTHKGVREWWPGSACLYSGEFAKYVTSLMEANSDAEKRGHGHVDWDESVDPNYTASSDRHNQVA